MSQRFTVVSRRGFAAALALFALSASLSRVSADAPVLTIASVTATGPGTVVVSGTVTPCGPQGQVFLQGGICQYEGRLHQYICSNAQQQVNPQASSPYTYAITFINPTGFKNGPATLTLSACCFDPSTFQTFCTTVSQDLHPH